MGKRGVFRDDQAENHSGPNAVSRVKNRPGKIRETGVKPRRRRSPAWVPNQHGAWGMALIPTFIGVYLSEPTWVQLPLIAFWVLGYFFFFAATVWLRARRAPRHFSAVLTYGFAATLTGLVTVFVRPSLIIWVPFFAPLVIAAAWESWHRRERSVLARTSTVLAACLMCLVSYSAGGGTSARPLGFWVFTDGSLNGHTGWVWTIFVGSMLAAYFWGTVPHVRALVRGRGTLVWPATSIIFHLLILAAVIFGVVYAGLSLLLILVWAVLLFRATLLPLYSRWKQKPVKPRFIGISEIIFNLAVVVILCR